MRDLPQGELTFMFTDVEGSTRLLSALGSRYLAVHSEHQQIVRSAVERHGGTEVSTEGDGFFVAFRDATQAAAAASEMLVAIERHGWPEDGRVRIRVGLHSGRAVLAADDYVGIDVNRAARIGSAANGGQILMSGATAAQVSDSMRQVASIRDLGRHRLKDVGVEQLYRLEPLELEPDERAPRTLEAAPSNLPAAPLALVDRNAERKRLTELLEDGRIVTVTGAGGIGKTALALVVANGLRDRFVDGIGYVDLAAVDNVETAGATLAEGLSFARDSGRSAVEILAEQLRGRDALLVIETADHLPAIGDVIAALSRECPSVRVLVTSRAALHLHAERELRLEPLSESAASELFVARARAVRPTFEPSLAEATAIEVIGRRLDGLPLALELAAARTRVLSPVQILERLENRQPVLSGGAADAPSRQRTLRDTVEWSYQQLTDNERVLLQTIGVLASDFGLEAVEGLAQRAPRGIDPLTVLDLLDGLVDKSLVTVREAEGSRFRLLSAIREFALEALSASGHADATRLAHYSWVLDIAQSSAAIVDSPNRSSSGVALHAYEEDLRAAIASALDTPGRALEGLELATAAGPFWYAFGRAREGSIWLERAIASAPAGRDPLHGDAHYWAGVLADERRMPKDAVEHLELSLAIRREQGDDAKIARTINSLGVVWRTAGDLGRARELLTECLALKRATKDPRIGSTITNLAIVAMDEGHFEEALGLFEDALVADRQAGSTEPHPAVLLGIALAQVRIGESDRAIDPLLKAAHHFADLEDRVAVAEALEVLVEAWQGRQPRAALVLLYASDVIRSAEGIARIEPDESRLQAIGASIRGRVAHDDAESAAAEGRALDAAGAVAFAEAAAASDAGAPSD